MLTYWLWLHLLTGVTPSQKRALLEYFHDPEELYRAKESTYRAVVQLPEEGYIALSNKDLTQARALAARGKTVILVIHDLSHAMTAGDHLVVLQEGRIAAEGAPEAVYGSGKIEEAFGIRLCRFPTEKGWRYYCEEK